MSSICGGEGVRHGQRRRRLIVSCVKQGDGCDEQTRRTPEDSRVSKSHGLSLGWTGMHRRAFPTLSIDSIPSNICTTPTSNPATP